MVRITVCRTIATLLLIASLATLAVGVGAADSTEDEPFEIEITESNETVTEGETLQVNATVTNTGDAVDSQQIHLKNSDEEIVDSIARPPLTLAPGENESVTLFWETANGDAAMEGFSVQSTTDVTRSSVDIRPGAFYDISLEAPDEPVTAGETIHTVVTTTNIGNASGTTNVSIAVGTSVENRTVVQLEPGETKQVALSSDNTDALLGGWILTATAGGAQAQTDVVIEATDQPTSATPTEYAETTASPTATATAVPDGTTENAQGFGIVVTLLALLSTALVAGRWLS